MSRVPNGLDISVPSAARMDGPLLGGGHNFGVDRRLAVRVGYVDHDPVAVAHSERHQVLAGVAVKR